MSGMMKTRHRTIQIVAQVMLLTATGNALGVADDGRRTQESHSESQEIFDMTGHRSSPAPAGNPLATFQGSRTTLERSGDRRFLIVTREMSDAREVSADQLAAIEYRQSVSDDEQASRDSAVDTGTVRIHEQNRAGEQPSDAVVQLGSISRREWERLEAELIDGQGNGFGPIISIMPGRARLTVPGPKGGSLDINAPDRTLLVDARAMKPFATSVDRIAKISYESDSGTIAIHLEPADEGEAITLGPVNGQAWSLLEAFFFEHSPFGVDRIHRE